MTPAPIYVVVPNWDGKASLADCLDSLISQSLKAEIVVVDNGSKDGSVEFLKEHYPSVVIIEHPTNLGFAGGVNAGFKLAIENDAKYVAAFNNDATADKDWLKNLVSYLDTHKEVGIATCKFLSEDGKTIDSTGDYYTVWGLPYPRGRDEPNNITYDQKNIIFGASGGASLYRVSALQKVGLFDEDFFAYFEDVDLSFRFQLAGWKVAFAPNAIAYHQRGQTSRKIKGFTTYQTMKNLPMLAWKNVPLSLSPKIFIRFKLAYMLFFLSASKRREGWYAVKGFLHFLYLFPKKLLQRRHIQKNRTVSVKYIDSMLTHDLPPNAFKLRKLRISWWKLRGKKA